MKNLNEKGFIEEISLQDAREINGGGEWSWGEAIYCTMIGGLLGLAAYTIGTMQ